MRKLILLMLMTCATLMQAQDDHVYNGFKAKLNGKTAVELSFLTEPNNGEWMSAGYIYYPNAKAPAPILIVEDWGDEKYEVPEEDNVFKARFVEYQPNGEMTGIIYLKYADIEGDFQMIEAQWKNPTTGRVMQFSDFEEMHEAPSWWPGTPEVFTAPKREAYHILYKLFNPYNEDSEWMEKIQVSFEVNEKKIDKLSFTEDLMGAFTSEQEETLDWVTENDINFDGIPDVMVFLGNSPRAQSLYKAFVWNPVTRQFYEVAAFDEIQEPDFNKKAKTITSYVRDVDGVYVDVYKWKNGVLKKVSEKKLTQH